MSKKKTRDAKATKTLILSAAEQLFAARGFAGTSISMVAEKSGLSGALVLFHFKDKQGLYNAVKEFIVQRYSEDPQDSIVPTDGLKCLLTRVIHAMFSFYRSNPAMIRMANWGRLEGDDGMWPGEQQWHHTYIEQIEVLQNAGRIRSDVSPYRVLILITGALHTWWEYHDHLLRDLGQRNCPDTADQQYMNELIAILSQGLAPGRCLTDSRENSSNATCEPLAKRKFDSCISN